MLSAFLSLSTDRPVSSSPFVVLGKEGFGRLPFVHISFAALTAESETYLDIFAKYKATGLYHVRYLPSIDYITESCDQKNLHRSSHVQVKDRAKFL